MEIFDSCGECIICDAAASAEHSIGIRCREGHYVCRRDLNQYMSHNVLSQLYKLKFNKCEVSCPETDCTATYDTLKLFDALEANERNRYIQIVSSMAADSSSPIIGIKNSLLDSLSLKCPHCSIAVDPAPDACSAVSCLSCGYFYCNCCFLSFGKGQLDRGSRDAHEHCALHDILRPRDQRSAFLTAETIEAGHRDTRKANFLTVLHDHFYRDGANRHEVLLATILCNDELKDADINIREAVGVVDSRCVNPGTTLASAVDLLHQLPMEAQEKNDDPKTTLLAQLANAMHQENAAASAQLLASMQDQDFDPNFTCDHCGQNLLILALFHGDRHVAETLLTGGRGFDPLCIMTNGQLAGQRTALYIAAEKGYMAELRLMMEVPGVSPASQASFDDNFGLTPLHVAVQYGQMAVVLYFIDELNADVNMPAALSPTTPLMAAVQFGKDDIVEVLVRRGARLDVQSREGRYPMYLAVEKGLVSTVKLLVNVCNVDINAPTTSEPTMGAALWIAIQCNKFYLIPLLISLGANVNAPDKEFGFTPLHYAILKGASDAVELLLLSGADPTIFSASGRSAMWMASELGLCGIVRLLVEKCENGVDLLLNAPCALSKEYPIHIATTFNKPATVAVMLNLGVDLTVTTANGLTAVEMAILQRPQLDDIVLLYGSYPERKEILDIALRRHQPVDRMTDEANNNIQVVDDTLDDDARLRRQHKDSRLMSPVVIAASCVIAIAAAVLYQSYSSDLNVSSR